MFHVTQLQSEWEAVSLELEQWVVCVRQLEDVLVLQTLLLVPPPPGASGGAAAQCSIKTLLEGGAGRLKYESPFLPVKKIRKLCFVENYDEHQRELFMIRSRNFEIKG